MYSSSTLRAIWHVNRILIRKNGWRVWIDMIGRYPNPQTSQSMDGIFIMYRQRKAMPNPWVSVYFCLKLQRIHLELKSQPQQLKIENVASASFFQHPNNSPEFNAWEEFSMEIHGCKENKIESTQMSVIFRIVTLICLTTFLKFYFTLYFLPELITSKQLWSQWGMAAMGNKIISITLQCSKVIISCHRHILMSDHCYHVTVVKAGAAKLERYFMPNCRGYPMHYWKAICK